VLSQPTKIAVWEIVWLPAEHFDDVADETEKSDWLLYIITLRFDDVDVSRY
jgi:hypothetical protein